MADNPSKTGKQLIRLVWLTILLVLPPSEAIAQTKEVIRLQADQIIYDEPHNLIYAIGNVEASYGRRLILAQKLIHNRNTQRIIAEDSVVVLEPDGTVHFAEWFEVTDDLKDGIAYALRTRLPDESRFAANGAIRTDGVKTEMAKGVYTPCKPCLEDPNRPPLWKIRASKIVHDREKRDIEYTNALVQFLGVPFLYTPYLSQPDPTVKRRSGFLAPSYRHSSLIGTVFTIPYYQVINDHVDFTFDPLFVTGRQLNNKNKKKGDFHIVAKGQARARFASGEMQIEGSFTRSEVGTSSAPTKTIPRGNINFTGEFDIDRSWRWGWDYNRTSDRGYLRRYGFRNRNILDQRVFVEGFRGRNYFLAETIGFQDLRPSARRINTPRSLPIIHYDFVSPPLNRGQFFTLHANTANLWRNQGENTHRFSLGTGWHLPVTTSGGHVLSMDVTMRGDTYYLTDQPTARAKDDGLYGRLFPQAALAWRWPLFHPLGKNRIILEPAAAFVASTNGNNPSEIPNEDSLAIEFDESDLFSPNRFSGYDRVETGQRVDYGLLLGLFTQTGGSVQFFLGQSYHLQKHDPFSSLSDSHLSGIVGRFILRTSRYINISTRFRMSHNRLTPLLNEVKFTVGPPIAKWSGSYLFVDQKATLRKAKTRREINLNFNSRLTDNWRFSAGGTRDLTVDDGMRYARLGLIYENDCFQFKITGRRTYTRSEDIEPYNTIITILTFKDLGEFRI